jgi:hypothetical protein
MFFCSGKEKLWLDGKGVEHVWKNGIYRQKNLTLKNGNIEF